MREARGVLEWTFSVGFKSVVSFVGAAIGATFVEFVCTKMGSTAQTVNTFGLVSFGALFVKIYSDSSVKFTS